MNKLYEKLAKIAMVMKPKSEGDAGGGDGSAPESKGNTEGGAPGDQGSKPQGDSKFDEFGYAKVPESAEGESDEGAADDGADKGEAGSSDSEEDDKVTEPGTGYGAEPPKAPEEKPPESKPAPEPAKLDYELNIDGLPEQAVLDLRQFAAAHKVPKEIAQAYADKMKGDALAVKQAEKDRADALVKRNAEWDKELRADPTFAKDFPKQVARAERVLQNYFPDLKKNLTENKQLLPPHFMRSLVRVADALYPAKKPMQQGEPSEVVKPNDPEAHLGFYNQPQGGGGN